MSEKKTHWLDHYEEGIAKPICEARGRHLYVTASLSHVTCERCMLAAEKLAKELATKEGVQGRRVAWGHVKKHASANDYLILLGSKGCSRKYIYTSMRVNLGLPDEEIARNLNDLVVIGKIILDGEYVRPGKRFK